MPVYFFWGEDDFSIDQAVVELEKKVLDPNWMAFNYHKLSGEREDSVFEALIQVMTPAFAMGGRLIWLADTTIGQNCPENLLSQWEKILPNIPENTHLLLTASKKPDGRLKFSKLLQEYALVREFSLISPWQIDLICQQIRKMADKLNLKLTDRAVELLAESVGSNTRGLWNELEKLTLYHLNSHQPMDAETIASLVICSTQNSSQLANAIRERETSKALALVSELFNRNEPALKIIATLIGQFRIWTIVKLMIEQGEKDEKKIATASEINNHKRIYFLRKEVQNLKLEQLLAILPMLMEVEFNLKKGADPLSTLQTKIVQICSF